MDKRSIVSLFHILVIGPALIYVGRSYGLMPDWTFWVLLLSGAFIFLYHGMKVYKLGFEIGWIYALHAILYAPLMMYIGYRKTEAFMGAYTTMIMLGFAAIGFHGMNVIDTLM